MSYKNMAIIWTLPFNATSGRAGRPQDGARADQTELAALRALGSVRAVLAEGQSRLRRSRVNLSSAPIASGSKQLPCSRIYACGSDLDETCGWKHRMQPQRENGQNDSKALFLHLSGQELCSYVFAETTLWKSHEHEGIDLIKSVHMDAVLGTCKWLGGHPPHASSSLQVGKTSSRLCLKERDVQGKGKSQRQKKYTSQKLLGMWHFYVRCIYLCPWLLILPIYCGLVYSRLWQ